MEEIIKSLCLPIDSDVKIVLAKIADLMKAQKLSQAKIAELTKDKEASVAKVADSIRALKAAEAKIAELVKEPNSEDAKKVAELMKELKDAEAKIAELSAALPVKLSEAQCIDEARKIFQLPNYSQLKTIFVSEDGQAFTQEGACLVHSRQKNIQFYSINRS